jgi:hypothetical protein
MALAVASNLSGSGTSVTSYTISSTSLGVAANDLVVVFIGSRGTVTPSGVTGFGITFTQVFVDQDTQNQCNLACYYGQSGSPNSNAITVNFGSTTLASIANAIRITGQDTADPIGASGSADTGAADTDTPSVTITGVSSTGLVVGGATHRTRTLTLGTGETQISLNNSVGTAGDITSISTFYNTDGTSSVTLNGTLDAAIDWLIGGVDILQAPSGFPWLKLHPIRPLLAR